MTCGIHQNDIGTEIRVQINDCNNAAIDISMADSKVIVFKKPNGDSISRNATFVTNGSDGLLYYIIADGDLTEVGTYKVQAIVTVGAYVWHSQFESFRVYRNL
jgi:hypothetical protein